jgi:hypothetical protein
MLWVLVSAGCVTATLACLALVRARHIVAPRHAATGCAAAQPDRASATSILLCRPLRTVRGHAGRRASPAPRRGVGGEYPALAWTPRQRRAAAKAFVLHPRKYDGRSSTDRRLVPRGIRNVEVHLHHDEDTADKLLPRYASSWTRCTRHGLLRKTDRPGRYVHPRELGPRQLAARRALVRRGRRAGRSGRYRMPCGHDDALGAVGHADRHDQLHLLRARRARTAEVARPRPQSRGRQLGRPGRAAHGAGPPHAQLA